MKQLSFTFLLTILLSWISVQASAHDIAVANDDGVTIYYAFRNNKTELAVSYRGSSDYEYSSEYSGSVVIPSSVTYMGKNYPVTSIDDYAFRGCSGLTSTTIPEGVTSIGYGAFYLCSSLTSITISEGVTSIYEEAFYGCSGLTSITIPEGVTHINDEAFYGCSRLASITIPESIISIGAYAFDNTKWYKNQPNGMIYVNHIAYRYKGRMPANTSIVLESGTTSIVAGAFVGCSNLVSIIIPESVTSIAGAGAIYSGAFSGCSGLTSIIIPKGVTSIGTGAFADCTGLTQVTINSNSISSKTYKSDSSFKYIFGTQVTEYILGENITSIGEYAFCNCSDLTSVIIPEGLTSVGLSAFAGCSSLKKVIVPNMEAWYKISFASPFSNPLSCAHHLYRDEETEITDLVIPEDVTSIGENAFYGCSGLTSITIPENVTSIGCSAFAGCNGLTSITIPKGVTIL